MASDQANTGLDPQKLALLRELLARVPPAVATKLVAAFEAARAAPGEHGAYDALLTIMRELGVAQAAAAPRAPTPQRLLLRSVEGLIDPTADDQPLLPGGFARADIAPVWDWLTGTVAPPALPGLEAKAAQLLAEEDHPRAEAVMRELRAVLAQALDAGLAPGAPARNALAAAGDRLVDSATRWSRLLKAEAAAAPAFAALPRRIVEIGDDLALRLSDTCKGLVTETDDLGPEFLLLVMSRLAKPWQIHRVTRRMTLSPEDKLPGAPMGVYLERLFALAEAAIAPFEAAARTHAFDPETLAGAVDRFGQMMIGLRRELEPRLDGAWDRRLRAINKRAGSALEEVSALAPATLEAAFPMDAHRVSARVSVDVPSRKKAPDAARLDLAGRLIVFLKETRLTARAAAFGSARDAAEKEVERLLGEIQEAVLRAQADPALREGARVWLEPAAGVFSACYGAEAASALRRRLAAA